MALAADAQRERTVGVLQRAYLEGRLELDEFTDRAGRALQARTTAELRALVRDLPWLADALSGARTIAVRAALIAGLAAVWVIASFALLISFLVALVVGVSGGEALLFPLAWVLLTWALWRVARR